MFFVQSWWVIVTNASKNEVRKVWLQNELILVGFGLAHHGGLAFFALVAKLVNK